MGTLGPVTYPMNKNFLLCCELLVQCYHRARTVDNAKVTSYCFLGNNITGIKVDQVGTGYCDEASSTDGFFEDESRPT